MLIRRADLIPYRLPLRRPWRSARGIHHSREGWLVCLETVDGRRGWGDCAPLPEAGGEDSATAGSWLQRQLGLCRERYVADCLLQLAAPDRAPVVARGALECALLDLAAQQAAVPLARHLCGDSAAQVAVNANAGALDENVTQRVAVAVAAGFGVVKLKVGAFPIAVELARLASLAAALPAPVRLRLDANGAWDAGQARHFLNGCAALPVESLEEPLQHSDAQALARLQGECPFPLAVDESLPRLGVAALAGAVRRVVIKAPLWGGLQPALALGRRARECGLECVVTSMLDSAAGVWAAAHLAAALDAGMAHGLATGEWLRSDTGAGPTLVSGRLQLPAVAGLGFVPHDDCHRRT